MEHTWSGIAVTISIFVITHIVITVWWASRVSTMLDYVQKHLGELVVELKSIKENYSKKEDILSIQSSQKAMWDKIDKIQEKINIQENKHG